MADAGDDWHRGGAGNDIMGGDGITGEQNEGGDDTMRGGDGNDALSGHSGRDMMFGDAGADTLRGGREGSLLRPVVARAEPPAPPTGVLSVTVEAHASCGTNS